MEQNFNGLGVRGHHDELGDTTVQGFGGFVGTLAQLLVVRGLLDQVQDLGGEGWVGQRVRFRVDNGRGLLWGRVGGASG